MSLEIIILKGLPSSGKTTFAKDFIKRNASYVILNRDSFRYMLNGYKFDTKIEKIITEATDLMILKFLEEGFNIILDETSLNPEVEKRVRALVEGMDVKIRINDTFLEIPIEECIRRDIVRGLKGEHHVGKKVIMGMASKYLGYKEDTYENKDKILFFEEYYNKIPFNLPNDKGKRRAIIVDLDGTLAKNNNRSPYDFSKVYDDDVIIPVKHLVENYLYISGLQNPSVKDKGAYHIIFLSGRDDSCFEGTKKWLVEKAFPGLNEIPLKWSLFMRETEDKRSDEIIKRELYEKYVKDYYNVEAVIDDRRRVVEMWRYDLGLQCFQVNDGEF